MKDRIASTESGDDLEQIQPGYLGITPPPGKLPEKGQRTWVDRPELLLHAVKALVKSSIVAVDAEFTQIRLRSQNNVVTYSQRLALLQLAIDGQCFVVDALRLNDLSPLTAVVENPAIIILLHGAGSDLRVMAERGLNVAHYYDLEATCRSIFGQHESSLAAMLQRAFQVRLDKSLQRTDWTRRPLPPAMVAYAARDAEMTLALYYWLDEHFRWALKIHESTNQQEPVTAWIEPFLRGASPVPADVLNRLDGVRSKPLILPLLYDPVQDVRKVVQTALRTPLNKEPRSKWTIPIKSTDGTRRWTVGETGETSSIDENDWKARLRSFIDE